MNWPCGYRLAAPVLALAMTAVASSSRGVAESVAQSSDVPLIQVRIVYDELAPEREQVDVSGETLFLGPAIVSDGDFTSVRANPRPSQETVLLAVEIDSVAAEKLRRVTGENVGGRLAMMVRREVRDVLAIQSAISSPLQMMVPVPSAEADAFLSEVRLRWP